MTSPRTFSDYAAQLRGFISDSLASPPTDEQFNHLARSLFSLQFAHNAPYRQFCESRKVTPDLVGHWSEIPAVPTVAFKELELTCLPVERRTRFFQSSGTTTQTRGRHFHNRESLALYEASLLPWFRLNALRELSSPIPSADDGVCFLSLTPPPAAAPNSSLVHMFATVMRECGSPESVFTGIVQSDGSWQVDSGRTLELLRERMAAGEPVVLVGTAFNFLDLLSYMEEIDERRCLPLDSRILETGGYKGRSRSLPKAGLHAMIKDRFGIPLPCIISEYGMCELSSQAYDQTVTGIRSDCVSGCEERVFRFPPWARVQIVSPETGREAAAGGTGLIRVFDLANLYSVLAIQTEDLGIRRGDGFELIGRAVQAEARGCSLMSA